MQVNDDSVLHHGGNNAPKWWNYEHILKTKPIPSTNILDRGVEEKKEESNGDSKVSSLSNPNRKVWDGERLQI